MSATNIAKPSARLGLSPSRRASDLVRTWLKGPRRLVILAIILAGGGAVLGWNWLVALGVAPLILSLAPCLVMCALGICMMSKGSSSCAKPELPEKAEPSDLTAAPRSSSNQ